MTKKKNQYEKKSSYKGLLGEVSEATLNETTQEALVRTGKDSVTDVGSGIAGGFAGAAMGKYSFLTGLGISAVSHFCKKHLGEIGSRIGSLFGVGMMTGGVVKITDKSVSGTEDKKNTKVEDAKERMKIFGEGLLETMHLDKIIHPKKASEATSKSDNSKQTKSTSTTAADTKEAAATEEKTVGEVQYFIYPNKAQKEKDVDLSDLDHFENGLHKSAAEYQQNKQTEGLGEDELGEDEEVKGTNDIDPEEKNY
jgi:hypothetical protein